MDVKKQSVPGAARAGDRPRHFHLLWDHELEELRPVLTSILEKLDDVVGHWYQLYELHFGDERTLSEAEFRNIFHSALDANTRDLIAGDMDRYAAGTIRTGELLAERKVPFAEVVASLHLYEESAYRAFSDQRPEIETYATFDKVCHIRMILLATAYFRAEVPSAGARIESLEGAAAQLPLTERTSFHGMIGGSESMHELYERIELAGATRGTILIIGESGTGKELVARAIHECEAVPNRPFIALNCAAVPKELIESELFGYKRGAFSGANVEYIGIFRAADGGTLFLDEITEMSPETQTKLLRALQEHTVRPVGATREIPVDVRVIASTNREPEEAVRKGQLREDLYYRLQASMLHVPPLRERIEDVPLLAEHFTRIFNERLHPRIPVTAIDPDAVEAMQQYEWPGNVRELSNAIEGAITFGRRDTIRREDLPAAIGGAHVNSAGAGNPAGPVGTFAEGEREIIRRALQSTSGNKVAAANLLRVSRKKLYAKIAKYGL
jgi:transcriptional regulator with PAS, ATPase and Fis domain